MPLINGVKMACEPCIRGHRSTKCNHASERLMVPVRKPGRPLSACPHGPEQPCTCGRGVTAAIPRNQACRCGSATQASTPPIADTNSATIPEEPSPTTVAFKVQKFSSRPASGRKSSIGAAGNLDRMDMSNVNIVSISHRLQSPVSTSNASSDLNDHTYGYAAQNIARHIPPSHIPTQATSPTLAANDQVNGCEGLGPIDEHFTQTPTPPNDGQIAETDSCCTSANPQHIPTSMESVASGSRSSPREDEMIPITPRWTRVEERDKSQSSCCSANVNPNSTKLEAPTNLPTPAMTPYTQHQHFPQVMLIPSFNAGFVPTYVSQPMIYTYPPNYGSYQHPLQPAQWRDSIRAMALNTAHGQVMVSPAVYGTPVLPQTLDTVHSCNCGDACQCVGCAAHPYNDATQDYVRSAWVSMYGAQSTQHHNNPMDPTLNVSGDTDMVPAPAEHTSPSTASVSGDVSGEEQSLSATDFFFVNYPFDSDQCSGNTNSCPCGDECECSGCLVHCGPGLQMPCAGAESCVSLWR